MMVMIKHNQRRLYVIIKKQHVDAHKYTTFLHTLNFVKTKKASVTTILLQFAKL